ncbi:hypothetical protein M6D93_05350 [Jatrophihabitans telluris]|uniref:Glyoxalase-like domain-containing protein n=1 Tax=Jatrophihabitans telluris TaxID=2038343 RepID=A0ABY4R2N7_9ACTN|nr:VOC family protein [Jatrophihabitans telluris]UQX89431.1 hypothetical protein M6D93_05350 [Jatrophihabitans telluris]
MTTRWTLTFDCVNAPALAAFWAEALGYRPAPAPDGYATWEQWLTAFEVPEDEWDDGANLEDPAGLGPNLSFLKVPEPKVVKNRLHLDLRVTGGRNEPAEQRRTAILAKAEYLVSLGAVQLAEHRFGEVLDHLVMADPEGNEFCIV